MKKTVLISLLLVIAMVVFAGCNGNDVEEDGTNDGGTTQSDTTQSDTIGDSESSDNVSEDEDNSWSANLYFPDSQAMNVVRETREMQSDTKLTTEEKAEIIMGILINEKSKDGTETSIPKTATVLSTNLEGSTMIVNMSSQFSTDHIGGTTGVGMTIAPIVLSLTDLEGVNSVRIKIDGQSVEDFKGHMSLNRELERSEYESIIK